MSEKKEKYFIMDWEDNDVIEFETREEAEEFFQEQWDDNDGDIDLGADYTIYKGVELNVVNPPEKVEHKIIAD